jgi:hypothetical protein
LKPSNPVTRRIASVARVVALLAAIDTASAQSGSGSIRGIVNDSTGAPQSGVTVRIRGTETYRHTDSRGQFAFDGLRPGSYGLTASYIGAWPMRDSVAVRAGDTARVRFVLHAMRFVVETLPPRVERGKAIDSVPAFAETTDLVARVARLPRLRPTAEGPPRRELRLWMGFGMGIPMQLGRITVEKGRVEGGLWHWVETSRRAPHGGEFADSLPTWLVRDFHCGAVAVDTLRIGGRASAYSGDIVAACPVQFRSRPDWTALLARLEAHRVWSLPDESELPQLNTVVNDGVGLVVEAWDGRRYRSYHFSNPDLQPSAEARDAQAILGMIVELASRERPARR